MTRTPPYSVRRILQALEQRGCYPYGDALHGYLASCPAHRGEPGSLFLGWEDGGFALLTCYARCYPEEVLAALGLRNANGVFAISPLGLGGFYGGVTREAPR